MSGYYISGLLECSKMNVSVDETKAIVLKEYEKYSLSMLAESAVMIQCNSTE